MPERKINLKLLIEGCRRSNRNYQRKLYQHFYGYAMNTCLRYAKNREEAVEMLNDGFLKVFNNLEKYDDHYPFKAWLRRILINSAIDYYRAHHKHPSFVELTAAEDVAQEMMPLPTISSSQDMLPILQKLSPAYRMVFNLYIMEEYKHHEIAEMLGISVSTSKSNLMRAKAKLKEILTKKKLRTREQYLGLQVEN